MENSQGPSNLNVITQTCSQLFSPKPALHPLKYFSGMYFKSFHSQYADELSLYYMSTLVIA